MFVTCNTTVGTGTVAGWLPGRHSNPAWLPSFLILFVYVSAYCFGSIFGIFSSLCRHCKQAEVADKQQADPQPSLNLGLKEGQRLRLNINTRRSDASAEEGENGRSARSRPMPSLILGGGVGGAGMIPPPPASSRNRQQVRGNFPGYESPLPMASVSATLFYFDSFCYNLYLRLLVAQWYNACKPHGRPRISCTPVHHPHCLDWGPQSTSCPRSTMYEMTPQSVSFVKLQVPVIELPLFTPYLLLCKVQLI